METGKRINWKTLNGTFSGVIVDWDEEFGYLVELDNGKHVVVDSKSIRYEEEH